MLYNINGKKMTNIPHQEDFKVWKSRLTQDEINQIDDAIHERVGDKEVNVSAWIPGNNWDGTPFHPIYEKACLKNYELSGKCFGLFVWEYMINDSESWLFTKQSMNDEAVERMIYFKGRV